MIVTKIIAWFFQFKSTETWGNIQTWIPKVWDQCGKNTKSG